MRAKFWRPELWPVELLPFEALQDMQKHDLFIIEFFIYPIKQAPGRASVGEHPQFGLTRLKSRLWKTLARDQTANLRTNRRNR